MSLDINFNKSIPLGEVESKTALKVVEKFGSTYLEDEYGNVVRAKGNPIYGITLYGGRRNPMKIIDELIVAFEIMFIDDDGIDKLNYEPEKYDAKEVFESTMIEYGYLLDENKLVMIPERNASEYLPYELDDNNIVDNLDEIKNKLVEMGYCVKNICVFHPMKGIELSDEFPKKSLLVELCSGENKSFNVFGEKIEEVPVHNENDDFPF